jgi:hypothetical protein
MFACKTIHEENTVRDLIEKQTTSNIMTNYLKEPVGNQHELQHQRLLVQNRIFFSILRRLKIFIVALCQSCVQVMCTSNETNSSSIVITWIMLLLLDTEEEEIDNDNDDDNDDEDEEEEEDEEQSDWMLTE